MRVFIVEKLGYQALTPQNKEEALQLNEGVTLIIISMMLPGAQDDFSFVSNLKRRWTDTPIVLIGGEMSTKLEVMRQQGCRLVQLPGSAAAMDELIRSATEE
jgi:DNA-binding NtrC family response regulator